MLHTVVHLRTSPSIAHCSCYTRLLRLTPHRCQLERQLPIALYRVLKDVSGLDIPRLSLLLCPAVEGPGEPCSNCLTERRGTASSLADLNLANCHLYPYKHQQCHRQINNPALRNTGPWSTKPGDNIRWSHLPGTTVFPTHNPSLSLPPA